MNLEWHDLLGTIGVIIILSTYLALQLSRINAQRLAYSVLNAIGASLILVSLFFDFNLSAFIIEASWVVISVFGVIVSLKRQSQHNI